MKQGFPIDAEHAEAIRHWFSKSVHSHALRSWLSTYRRGGSLVSRHSHRQQSNAMMWQCREWVSVRVEFCFVADDSAGHILKSLYAQWVGAPSMYFKILAQTLDRASQCSKNWSHDPPNCPSIIVDASKSDG